MKVFLKSQGGLNEDVRFDLQFKKQMIIDLTDIFKTDGID